MGILAVLCRYRAVESRLAGTGIAHGSLASPLAWLIYHGQ